MLTGSVFRVSVQAARQGFRLLSGQLKTYIKTAESGNKRAHSFCPNCGTPVHACTVTDDPPSFNLRVGGLKQRHQLPPKKRIWCRSELAWAQNVSAVSGRERQR